MWSVFFFNKILSRKTEIFLCRSIQEAASTSYPELNFENNDVFWSSVVNFRMQKEKYSNTYEMLIINTEQFWNVFHAISHVSKRALINKIYFFWLTVCFYLTELFDEVNCDRIHFNFPIFGSSDLLYTNSQL